MERPALKRLLADIEASKVDVVVVYKIDRLTRSLADFARMLQGHKADGPGIRRVPGPALESLLSTAIRRLSPASTTDPLVALRRVEVCAESLQLLCPVALLASMRARLEPNETVEPDAVDPTLLRLTLPVHLPLRGGRSRIIGATKRAARPDAKLIKALRAAHAMLQTDSAGLPTLDIAPASPYRRRLIRLAFLAPDLQRAILAGQQPPGLTLERLMHAATPILWSEQEAMIEQLAATKAGSGRSA